MTDSAALDRQTRLEAWLTAVPVQVRSVLEAPAGTDASPVGLARAAEDALGRAERADGLHGGAFDLLAADGLMTLACLAALDDAHPGRVLDDLLAGVAS